MPTNVSYNGTTYPIPLAGELNWTTLSAFLIDVGQTAGLTTIAKQAIRTAVTSPVTVSSSADYTVVTNLTTPGAVAVNLPAGVNGQVFVIVDGKGDAATNNITITPNGAATIAGGATLVLTQNRQTVILQYSTTGTTWNLLGSYYAALATSLANPMTTTGDTIYSSSNTGTPARLPIGAAGTVLKGGTTPSYAQVATADIANLAVTTGKLANLAVTDAKIDTGIDGSKIIPGFGSQNITTTGSLSSNGINSATGTGVPNYITSSSGPSVAHFGTLDASSGRTWLLNTNNTGGVNNIISLGFGPITAGVPANPVFQIYQNGAISIGGGSLLSTYITGTYAASWFHGGNGFASNTITYTKIGNQVTVSLPSTLQNASAAVAPLTVGGLPAAMRPTAVVQSSVLTRDAGSQVAGVGRAQIDTAGLITIYTNNSGGNFTASGGQMGLLQAYNFTYLVV